MTMKNDGGSAFPLWDGTFRYSGMSLRDWFAGQALQGMNRVYNAKEAAKSSYEVADAMLAEREK